jgi:AcrR family transcriptional regulator
MARTEPNLARKEQILTAAAAVFARRGLSQARMDDIVKEAGLSKGTLYWYFESKDAVIEALMQQIFDPEFAWLREMTQQHEIPVAERLGAFVARSVAVVERIEEQGLLPLFADYIALAARNERARQVLQDYNQAGRDLLVPLFQQAVESGEFRPVDPDIAYMSFATLIDGLTISVYTYPHHLPLSQRIQAATRLLLDGLRAPEGGA